MAKCTSASGRNLYKLGHYGIITNHSQLPKQDRRIDSKLDSIVKIEGVWLRGFNICLFVVICK